MVHGRLEVSHEPDGPIVTLTVEGDLDFTSAANLRKQVEAVRRDRDGNERIVLDLSGIQYIDSTGLSQLVWAHSEARTKDWELAIVSPSDPVKFYMERTGLDQILPVE